MEPGANARYLSKHQPPMEACPQPANASGGNGAASTGRGSANTTDDQQPSQKKSKGRTYAAGGTPCKGAETSREWTGGRRGSRRKREAQVRSNQEEEKGPAAPAAERFGTEQEQSRVVQVQAKLECDGGLEPKHRLNIPLNSGISTCAINMTRVLLFPPRSDAHLV